MGNRFVQALIKRATHASDVLACTHPIESMDFDASLPFLFEISRCCISKATTEARLMVTYTSIAQQVNDDGGKSNLVDDEGAVGH